MLLAIGVATSALPTRSTGQCLEQKLLAPEGKPGDYFGFSIALDRTTAVVGAPYGGRGPNFNSFGVVLVYELGTRGWELAQEIEPTDGDPGMAFGHSVGVSRRWLVVGAPYYDEATVHDAGATYVYERLDSGWVFHQKLRATGTVMTASRMGYSVAVDGDWLVTGVPGWSPLGPPSPGNAYVWRFQDEWQVQGNLFGAGCFDNTSANLGASVALSGTTVLAGAPQWNWWIVCPTVPSYGGGAFVRTFDGALMFQALPNPGPGPDFGEAVAVSGSRAMIGAPQHSNGSLGSGAVYAYEKSHNPRPRLNLTQTLEHPEATPAGKFGMAIAMSGEDALVLAFEAPKTVVGYHYRYGETSWVLAGKLSIVGEAPYKSSALAAISGVHAMIGMPQDDPACSSLYMCSDAGSAYAVQLVAGATQYCTCKSMSSCGNFVSYGGCRNSTGQGATLRACGTVAATTDDLRMECHPMPADVPAILQMGPRPDETPYGDGLLCVGPGDKGLFRFPGQNSGPDGLITLGPGIVAFSNANFPLAGHIQPGESWYFQAWYRDPNGPCSTGFNLSNGLQVDFTQ